MRPTATGSQRRQGVEARQTNRRREPSYVFGNLRACMWGSHVSLPVLVLSPIECDALRLGVHVENVLAIPGIGSGVILHGPQSPLSSIGHRINRNVAQELQLLA